MNKIISVMVIMLWLTAIAACGGPQVKLFSDASDPLKEFTIQGRGDDKVLVISINGTISTSPNNSFLRSMPSMVQEVVAQLRKAEKDKHIKSVLIKVDSPGGTTTASDMLYHEILAYKKKTDVKIVVSMMGVAASGGYYISLPADTIMAHPTTVTGSVGVILMQPDVTGLMEKIGVDVHVNKSGDKKDMGSPFRKATPQELALLQGVIDGLAARFVGLVQKHRKLDEKAMTNVATARIYLAQEAKSLGLVDSIGYLDDALKKARELAGLPADAKAIAYRRTKFPDDNLYNGSTANYNGTGPSLIDIQLPVTAANLSPGFYYIWAPAVGM